MSNRVSTTSPEHTASFSVTGMTCDHCVRSVTEEVQQITGVRAVTIELISGTATILSDRPVEVSAVRAAVAEAGYQLV